MTDKRKLEDLVDECDPDAESNETLQEWEDAPACGEELDLRGHSVSEIIYLNKESYDNFAKNCQYPPEPNDVLQRALRRRNENKQKVRTKGK